MLLGGRELLWAPLLGSELYGVPFTERGLNRWALSDLSWNPRAGLEISLWSQNESQNSLKTWAEEEQTSDASSWKMGCPVSCTWQDWRSPSFDLKSSLRKEPPQDGGGFKQLINKAMALVYPITISHLFIPGEGSWCFTVGCLDLFFSKSQRTSMTFGNSFCRRDLFLTDVIYKQLFTTLFEHLVSGHHEEGKQMNAQRNTSTMLSRDVSATTGIYAFFLVQ